MASGELTSLPIQLFLVYIVVILSTIVVIGECIARIALQNIKHRGPYYPAIILPLVLVGGTGSVAWYIAHRWQEWYGLALSTFGLGWMLVTAYSIYRQAALLERNQQGGS